MSTNTKTISKTARREVSLAFRAMNTDVTAIVVGAGDLASASTALDLVESLFAETEATLSRFRESSELSALNRTAGSPFSASPTLFEVVTRAVEAAQATGGIFDPTILGSLRDAGYDRSFEQLAARAGYDSPIRFEVAPRYTWRDVRLDPVRQIVEIPPGCGIDLGGIGKGWTTDRAVELLRPFGSFAIDAGGDLYAAGTQADGSHWTVGVEDPARRESDIAELEIDNRAVATSTVTRRRWLVGDEERHHLIDPRTGQSSQSGILSVTVVAGRVADAEVLAKVALLLGPEPGLRLLEAEPDAEGLIVLNSGQLESTSSFREVSRVA